MWKQHGATLEFRLAGIEAAFLVAIGSNRNERNAFLTQILDQARSRSFVFDQDGCGHVFYLELFCHSFEPREIIASAYHLEQVIGILLNQPDGRDGIIRAPRYLHRGVPADNDTIGCQTGRQKMVVPEPFALDDVALAGNWLLEVLRGKLRGPHLRLDLI